MKHFPSHVLMANAAAAVSLSTVAALNSVSADALGLNLARFDGEDATITAIRNEIKQFSSDQKGQKDLQESMQRDLTALRKLVDEQGKNQLTPEMKTQLEALSASVAEKHTALEANAKKVSDQLDALETAFKRAPLGTRSEEVEAKQIADALKFFETKQALTGNLSITNRLDPEKMDREGYKSWEQAFDLYLRVPDERILEAKTLQVGNNPDGGYLVPTARSQRIIQKIFETSPLRGLATIETIGTTELELPVDIDEASVGWVGETETRSTTNTPQVGVQKIPVHEIYAKPRATQKFLEDASINVESWLGDKVADKMGRTEATAFISGNGINKPRGILTYTAGSAGARGTIAQYASGGATSITADAIVAMPFRLKSAYLAGSSWLMKRSTIMALMLLKDGQGQYLWRPGLTAGAPSMLVGYNVNPADDMPAVTASSLSVAFGNWARGYTIVDRLGITTLRDPYSAKPFVEFYTRKRVGGDVVDFEAFALLVTSAS